MVRRSRLRFDHGGLVFPGRPQEDDAVGPRWRLRWRHGVYPEGNARLDGFQDVVENREQVADESVRHRVLKA